MNKFCHSCAAPLEMPEMKGPAENYCVHCTDESGKLKTREMVQFGIAEWFKTWQPGVDQESAMARAASYLDAMPAWAK